MLIHDGTTTSSTLLLEIRNWGNVDAWHRFFRIYHALLDRWCRVQLDAAAAEEVSQAIWIELTNRMRTFHYDPRKSFRGWLRTLCRCRVIDFVRARGIEGKFVRPFDDAVLASIFDRSSSSDEEADQSESNGSLGQLLREAEAVQAAARRRLSQRTWEVFWQIAIADRSVEEVAAEYGMTYAAAYRAFARTNRTLREEGDKRRATSDDPAAAPPCSNR